ncbi:hypothetical protein [Cyclobacterium plantarum]|uniref:hypothetical protein n=1 Tax=Cyclobacterium plantarum TaxID=2716263 RepID=UPI003F719C61
MKVQVYSLDKNHCEHRFTTFEYLQEHFIAEYTDEMKVSRGGGLKEEQENIEVLELPFNVAFEMIQTGEIKEGKTVILLQYLRINNLIPPVHSQRQGADQRWLTEAG